MEESRYKVIGTVLAFEILNGRDVFFRKLAKDEHT